MIGKTIEALHEGDTARFGKTISESDIYLYAGITGDQNPAHINESYARETFFKTRIAHGALLVGFISNVMAKMTSKIPPPGGVSYRYDVKFTAPVKFCDSVTTQLMVTKKNPERREIILEALCTNQREETVLRGQTTLKVI